MIREFDEFVLNRSWREAVTYREICPHEYTVREGPYDAGFYNAVRILRDLGFWAAWRNRTGIYLIRGDYYYWTMGAPLQVTKVINRAVLKNYNLIGGVWEWQGENV